MSIDQLIFIGLNGYAVALDRETGQIVWSNNEMKRGYVTLMLEGDQLIVSTNGYIYCLDPLTGQILWNNPMKGYGIAAPTSIVSLRGSSDQIIAAQAAKAAADQAASGG
jgi:outer membrane protein assembly factor BamB